MKRFNIVTILLFASLNIFAQETEYQYLSGKDAEAPVDWEFMVTGGRRANEWATIPVPSNWELHGFGTYNYGHDKNKGDEQGIYRHPFIIEKVWQGKRIFIVFEGAMTDTEVRINGQLAGPIHQGGFYRFECEITERVFFDKENLLEVAVSKMSANESINLAERQADYWVFGGIFRPVYLKAVPGEHISRTAIKAEADGRFLLDAYLDGIQNGDLIQAQIIQQNGVPLGEKFSKRILKNDTLATLTTLMSGHKTWTAETPHLYFVDISLKDGLKTIHTVREQFGFRTIEVKEGEGIFLNGERTTLKGCNRHSFWPTTGRALSRNRCYKDVMLMKEMNMNAVRMSHYPPDTYFLDLCDEHGLYVLDELGGWQKPPYDTPTGKRLVKELVIRDVNHPSILFWDNGNEGGWNTDLDDEFEKYDLQKRPVLHPWELHGGIDTDHYESYESVVDKLKSGHIFMPTEHLHGLYDGGHGAGLDDYWRIMWGHPLNGGMFLWNFADEGVVRTDKCGAIDADGNHGPDGILGPFHEKEGSFYTIKEIWSPVYIETNTPLPGEIPWRIPVENRYDFTNLNQCCFEWQLVKYRYPAGSQFGSKELYRGRFMGPDILPHQKGFLNITAPDGWQEADGLILTAYNKNDQEIYSWKWKLKNAASLTKTLVNIQDETPLLKNRESAIDVIAGSFQFSFDKNRGRLTHVKQGERVIPFGNGPVFVADGVENQQTTVQIKIKKTETSQILKITDHDDFDKLQWTIYGSGWLKLDYAFSHEGLVDYLGISFDYPEDRMQEMTWLGKGPYRVWKNRLKGQTVDVWHNTYKNFQTGKSWDYPEFVGYYADFNWVNFKTDDGHILIATNSDDLSMRVFSQTDGSEPRHTKMSWPEGDISFLNAIPAIGIKFQSAEKLGPQSQKFKASGSYGGTLFFYFGLM